MIKVEIDGNGGFCGGVIRALGKAEEFLSEHPGESLYSLGEIVHNESELERLHSLGLVALDEEDMEQMVSASGATILIRAHGQPPVTYGVMEKLGFKVIDCTCPVVLGIQKKIDLVEGDVIIYGKKGHPEVLGLVGHVKGRALVIENYTQALELIGSYVPAPGSEIFSQTTMSPVEYDAICGLFSANYPQIKVHKTICAQVATRHETLRDFARAHDVIVFVTGKSSSNGRVLRELCQSVNIRTYQVSSISEIQPDWFREDDLVGVSGATSTPRWLLEQVAEHIANLR